MRILALDIATTTGWAVMDEGIPIASGVLQLDDGCPKKGGEWTKHPYVLERLGAALEGFVAEYAPDLLFYEEGFQRGAGSKLLHRCIAVAMLTAARKELPILGSTSSTIRKVVFGNGGLSKEAAKAAGDKLARSLGVDPKTDDESDAVVVGVYAHKIVRKIP